MQISDLVENDLTGELTYSGKKEYFIIDEGGFYTVEYGSGDESNLVGVGTVRCGSIEDVVFYINQAEINY